MTKEDTAQEIAARLLATAAVLHNYPKEATDIHALGIIIAESAKILAIAFEIDPRDIAYRASVISSSASSALNEAEALIARAKSR